MKDQLMPILQQQVAVRVSLLPSYCCSLSALRTFVAIEKINVLLRHLKLVLHI